MTRDGTERPYSLPLNYSQLWTTSLFKSKESEKIDLSPLEERLKELEIRCENIERTARSLNLEFTELYDKVSHQMSRMAKRYTAANKDNGDPPEPDQATSHLDSLDPISKSIMLRRGGYGRR